MLALIKPVVQRRLPSPVLVSRGVPVAPALGRAFSAAADHDTPDRRATLQEATVAFVRRLRSDGLPPERVVVALKAAITKYSGADWQPFLTNPWISAEEHSWSDTYEQVFEWSVEAYYDAP